MEKIWVVLLVWAAMAAAELPETSGCLEKERLGLTELRRALPPDLLKAFPENDACCSSDGVYCAGASGRVRYFNFYCLDSRYRGGYLLNISLFLPFEELVELNFDGCGLDGLINQADLTKLTRLETISFAGNSLNNIDSLRGICEMKNIEELDLSSNNIRSHIPPCIGNLTRLRYLDMSSNQISGNIPSTMGNLSRLSFLSLQGNYGSGSFSLHILANNSRLELLDLSYMHNDFRVETETQSWLPSFQLWHLDLSGTNLNKMSGSGVPTFLLHQSELKHIALSNNKLRGAFPFWLLQNNSKLDILGMESNSLTGNFILPNFTHSLIDLRISNNKIGDKLPDNMQVFLPALIVLDFSFNSFTGKLPKTLFGNNGGLYSINFSNNLLEGEIDLNLTTLPYLKLLDLSNNKFNGSIEDLRSSELFLLDVSNNLISGKLPKSLGNFSFIYVLRVSNNSFQGGIPDELCGITKLQLLDLSYNKFSGTIPFCLRSSSIEYLYMQNCSLSGVIPQGLFSNSTLKILDLSYNSFSPGIFPDWIYKQHNLESLLMAGLRLEGEISTQLCRLKNMRILDLSRNNFNGTILSCLFKRPFWVARNRESLLDSNELSLLPLIRILFREGSLEVEFNTKGRPIKFKGSILDLMSGLDVSSNKLSGQLPPQIGDAEAIHTLNLSNNQLWGSIPNSISKLRDIESLDLSSNHLSGRIPPEIVRLTFLSTFDVSNNNLSGPVPTGEQFGSFDEKSYRGNELLCGPPLQRTCRTSSPSTTPADEDDIDGETIFDRTSFWWSFVAAFITVIVSLVVLVGMETHFSRVWFATVDAVCSNLVYVFVKMKLFLGLK